ncbi:hypothetical protein UVI_02037740 [Ustilaginoidea virens]|uniref:Uncharacterized protein n=1 Tax=Ustilaginoidea virens TaxID=1159556 RepID=A0A1B5KT73_USTVR|nr:hypothetical protein UVI_02037740 [Ustilaginoidea virens]
MHACAGGKPELRKGQPHPTTDVNSLLASGLMRHAQHVWSAASLVSGVWCLVSGVRCLVSGVWCLWCPIVFWRLG